MAANWRQGITLALIMMSSTAAQADLSCSVSRSGFHIQNSDPWFGTEKLKHIGVSVPFGALGAYLTRDTDHPVIYGTLIGSVPGLLVQIYDGTCPSDSFSYKDLTADVVGALTGALLTNWAITYSRDAKGKTVGIAYHTSF